MFRFAFVLHQLIPCPGKDRGSLGGVLETNGKNACLLHSSYEVLLQKPGIGSVFENTNSARRNFLDIPNRGQTTIMTWIYNRCHADYAIYGETSEAEDLLPLPGLLQVTIHKIKVPGPYSLCFALTFTSHVAIVLEYQRQREDSQHNNCIVPHCLQHFTVDKRCSANRRFTLFALFITGNFPIIISTKTVFILLNILFVDV